MRVHSNQSSNSHTNTLKPQINEDSLLSQILSNQKGQQNEQRKWNWIALGFSAAVVAISGFYVYSERQQHDRVNQQLQQQLQREQNFSGFKVSVLESMLEIVVKRLSAQSGESEEAIMSSAVKQTEHAITVVGQGQVPGALEAARSKSTKV